MRSCAGCGDPLPLDTPHWKKVCLNCFRAKKRAEVSDMATELFLARARINELTAQLHAIAQYKPPVIEPAMMTKLLMLCHPDRHGNTPTSNEVTRFLLELRKGTT